MVALEGLKTSINYLTQDMDQISQTLKEQEYAITGNQDDIYTNMQLIGETYKTAANAVSSVQDKCHYAQNDLKSYRDAVVLYCQQFAFSPEMVHPCSSLLKYKERNIPFRYRFTGSYVHPDTPHDSRKSEHQPTYHKDDPQTRKAASSHGIELIQTGGNVKPQIHVDPEIAAAAVSPYEAVIQIDGKSIIAPMDQIDASKLELACDLGGCTLIPDDGNPHNDIIVPGMKDTHYHAADPHPHAKIVKQDTSKGYNIEQQFPGGPGHLPQHHDQFQPELKNTHGIELPVVGGNVAVGHHVDAELAAAAYDKSNVVIVHEGEAFLAPISTVNPDVVELACSEEGCVLIKDDGNPHNDIIVPGMEHNYH